MSVMQTFEYNQASPATNSVKLCGSWCNWQQQLQMQRVDSTRWTLTINVPPGKQSFKFVVDGEWRESKDYDTTTDERGMVNNVVHVVEQEQKYEQNDRSKHNQDDRYNVDHKQQEVKQGVEQEVKQEVKREVKQGIEQREKQEVKQEVEQEEKQEVRQEVKQEAEQKVEQEVKQESKPESKQEVKQEAKQEAKQKDQKSGMCSLM